jgi:L-lactate utilization protein LutB
MIFKLSFISPVAEGLTNENVSIPFSLLCGACVLVQEVTISAASAMDRTNITQFFFMIYSLFMLKNIG